jgi:RNA polymerase sigma-70 factor (ECF subfamily)
MRSPTLPPDDELLRRLQQRDEATFVLVLDAWSPGMLRLARSLVTTRASAEEVVQDTWLAVVGGLSSFQGRSSLRTWVYRILVNTAKRRGQRESRTVLWSSWEPDQAELSEPTVDPARFQDATEDYPGHWRSFPQPWPSPEGAALQAEVRARVQEALEALPARQRVVVTLRDVEGYSSEEVCEILGISAANQRVLLHRGRAAVRGRLEEYFASHEASATDGEGRA